MWDRVSSAAQIGLGHIFYFVYDLNDRVGMIPWRGNGGNIIFLFHSLVAWT